MSLAGLTTEMKCVLWERKYRCDSKGKKIYVKFVKTKYNKARRREAVREIEDALYDIKPDEEFDCDYVQEMAPLWWDEYNEDPDVAARREAWDRYDDILAYEAEMAWYDEDDEYYATLDEIEAAYRGDWQAEVPEVFGDEFEAVA